MATPATETSDGRIRLEARSYSSDPVIWSAETCRASTGTDEALYDRICGGVIPAGICFSTVCETAVTCACAAATSVERLALDVLDVAHGGRQRAFVVVNDASRHVFRREAVIGPDDRHDGDRYIREDVRRRAQRGASAENEVEDRQNHERIRPLQGYDDNRIHACARAGSSAPTATTVSGPNARPSPAA